MQYVLHITQRCNFACDYCSAAKGSQDMDIAIARHTADYALRRALERREATACISFYGGEPLLRKAFIRDTISYCDAIAAGTGIHFHYRMTTNASLLDNEFIAYAKRQGIKLALSIDGDRLSHDAHRRGADGRATFDEVLPACQAALAAAPFTPAMLTINPDTAVQLYANVRFLYAQGFNTICTTPNYIAPWTQSQLDQLGEQYQALADWYAQELLAGKTLKLPLLDNKLVNSLLPQLDEAKCTPGRQRMSIAADGSIYPCSHYVHFPAYAYGGIAAGPDEERLHAIQREAVAPLDCAACALAPRCDNSCGCKNLATTGRLNGISPLVCAHERMLIPIADRLAASIFA